MRRRILSRALLARLSLIVISASLSLGTIEGWSRLRDVGDRAVTTEARFGPDYYALDEVLGYAPANATVARIALRREDTIIYDVTYTIGPDRLRVSPSAPAASANDCAIFFGDSFTYGEGVNDDEAFPFVVGRLSRSRVYNFGFHGYGPQQMLAAIQRGRVAGTVACQPRLILYQALEDHPWRAAGRTPWDRHGPKYDLSGKGLTYEGHFDDRRVDRLRRRLRALLARSSLYRRYVDSSVGTEDLARFIAIVAGARAALQTMYPAAAFHVLLWNASPDDGVVRREHDALSAAGLTVHLVSDVLPHYSEDPLQYALSPFDAHPNAAAHRLVAEYVVNHLFPAQK